MVESRKDRERELRRVMLLEAASRVFGRKPFSEATMQEVAADFWPEFRPDDAES